MYIYVCVCEFGYVYIKDFFLYIGYQIHENEEENSSNTSSAGSSKA